MTTSVFLICQISLPFSGGEQISSAIGALPDPTGKDSSIGGCGYRPTEATYGFAARIDLSEEQVDRLTESKSGPYSGL